MSEQITMEVDVWKKSKINKSKKKVLGLPYFLQFLKNNNIDLTLEECNLSHDEADVKYSTDDRIVYKKVANLINFMSRRMGSDKISIEYTGYITPMHHFESMRAF